MSNLFETKKDVVEYIFRITDNGGAYIDRYTVQFTDGQWVSLSPHPSHPLGVSTADDRDILQVTAEKVEEGTEVDIAFGDLDERIQNHILYRANQGLSEVLEKLENNPDQIASSRDDVEENEGLYTSFGQGIYRGVNGYMIKVEGGPEEDYGPFETIRDALLGTIPDDYSLAGPEYHSTVDVKSLKKSDEIAAAVAALEARVEAGDAMAPGM